MNIEKTFLKHLRAALEGAEWGAKSKIAKKIGVSSGTFSNMLSGTRGTTEIRRRQICEVIGLDYDKIVQEAKESGIGINIKDTTIMNDKTKVKAKKSIYAEGKMEVNNAFSSKQETGLSLEEQHLISLIRDAKDSAVLLKKVIKFVYAQDGE